MNNKLYRRVDEHVIPLKGFKLIKNAHHATQTHALYNVSGASTEMKEAMGNMVYKEAPEVGVKTVIPPNTNILLLNPSGTLLASPHFLKQVDSLPIGSCIICMFQDVNLRDNEIEYDDSSLPFWSRAKGNFVLTANKRIQTKRVKYEDDIDHIYSIYTLKRADVVKHNDVDKGKFEAGSLRAFDNGEMNSVDDKRYFQHPVKSYRRIPVLLKPNPKVANKDWSDPKNIPANVRISRTIDDMANDIDPKRNDIEGGVHSLETSQKIPKIVTENDGFMLEDKDRTSDGTESRTFKGTR